MIGLIQPTFLPAELTRLRRCSAYLLHLAGRRPRCRRSRLPRAHSPSQRHPALRHLDQRFSASSPSCRWACCSPRATANRNPPPSTRSNSTRAGASLSPRSGWPHRLSGPSS